MPTRHQALVILTRPATEAVLIAAHGFTREQIDQFVAEGLAVPIKRRGAVWLELTQKGREARRPKMAPPPRRA